MTSSASPSPLSRLSTLLLGVVVVLVAASAIAVALILHGYHDWRTSPLLSPETDYQLVVARGSTWSDVAEQLVADEVVHHRAYFLWWYRRHAKGDVLKAGTYRLKGPLSLDEFIATLTRGGDHGDVRVTIPEGFTIFHIADKLESLGLAGRRAFLEACRDRSLLDSLQIPGESVEGYLFPDTYRFEKGTSPHDIIRRMHQEWLQQWDSLRREHQSSYLQISKRVHFSDRDFMTLASIIQRESHIKKELPIIARVFYNRLRKEMKLQTDPTCVYGPDTYKKKPHPKYCKDPLNRYSTYVVNGLPPGPISNPGADAIKAALAPVTSLNYKNVLYFVANPDTPGHTFSNTYQEHKRAVKRLKQLKQLKQLKR